MAQRQTQTGDQGSKSCLHGACSCDAEGDTSYCSDYCRAAYLDSPSARSECQCGHEGCSGR